MKPSQPKDLMFVAGIGVGLIISAIILLAYTALLVNF